MSKELASLQVRRFELEYEISRAKDALTDLQKAEAEEEISDTVRSLLIDDLEDRIVMFNNELLKVWEKIYSLSNV